MLSELSEFNKSYLCTQNYTIMRKSVDRKNGANPPGKITANPPNNNAKPVFPAYVPSHLEMNKTKNDEKEDHEARRHLEHNQLYVTNLPTNTNMAEISKVFPECVGIELGVNERTESHAAYLEFQDPETAQLVCQRNRGSSIRGNTLIISPKLKYN